MDLWSVRKDIPLEVMRSKPLHLISIVCKSTQSVNRCRVVNHLLASVKVVREMPQLVSVITHNPALLMMLIRQMLCHNESWLKQVDVTLALLKVPFLWIEALALII